MKRQPSLRENLKRRLESLRSQIHVLAEMVENADTPAVLAEQYLIEVNQLEYEEAFLLDALNKPRARVRRYKVGSERTEKLSNLQEPG